MTDVVAQLGGSGLGALLEDARSLEVTGPGAPVVVGDAQGVVARVPARP